MENLPLDLLEDCPDNLVFDLLHILRYMDKWLEMGNTSVPRSTISNLLKQIDEKLDKINTIKEE